MDTSSNTRQKSCNICVRGKRRCDKRTPRCTRCAAKGLDCVYRRPLHPLQAQPRTPASTSTSTSTSESSIPTDSPPEDSTSSSFTFDCPPAFTIPDSILNFSLTDFLTPDAPPPLPFDNPSTSTSTSTSNIWDTIHDPLYLHSQKHSHQKLDLPQPPTPPNIASPLGGPSDDPFVDVDVEQVHDPRSRIGFIVREFSDLHASFAQRRATSFMHPRLYASALPKPVMLAFSAAAAYAGRTAETRGWALKMVQHAVREVYRDAERPALPAAASPASFTAATATNAPMGTSCAASGEASPLSSCSGIGAGGGIGGVGTTTTAGTVVEKLARLQALVLLNAMRVFDGDVGTRAAAERELGVMVSWTKELLGLRSELEDGLPAAVVMSKDRPPQSWESWILLESTRRTIVMSFALKCLVSLLKTGQAPCYLWANEWSFTTSRHLWGAQSSVEFFRAWREKPQFCVTNLIFKEVWKSARPEDIDDFTRIMLTPQVGVDAMDTFMLRDATISV